MGDKVKSKTIFDYLNDITFNKTPWEDDKRFQPYMVSRWLSMHPDYLPIVAEVQPITSRLSSREFYVFFTDLLPKRKFYVKYAKGGKNSRSLLVSFVAEKYQIGNSDAEFLIEGATSSDLREFLAEYGEFDYKKYDL